MADLSALWTVPGYQQSAKDIYSAYVRHSSTVKQVWGTPLQFWEDLGRYGRINHRDVYYSLILALVMTVLRYVLTAWVFLPLGRYLRFTQCNIEKFPESGWKGLYYGCTWVFAFYLLFYSGKYDYFHIPDELWKGWSVGMEVSNDIYCLYLVHFAFYLHSVYATIFMDPWRKDSIAMLVHHALTMSLLGFSYAVRYHRIGLLVLSLHDIADVWLEVTKFNVYMKDRGNTYHKLNDYIADCGFVIFASSWFYFRLYLFPQKVMHSAACGIKEFSPLPEMPFYAFFNLLLWILLLMNTWWFSFILSFLYKVGTGQLNELKDVRENEEANKLRLEKEEREAQLRRQMANGGKAVSNGVAPTKELYANGKIVANGKPKAE